MNEELSSYPEQQEVVASEGEKKFWKKRLFLILVGAVSFILFVVLIIGVLILKKESPSPSVVETSISPVPEKIDPIPSQGVISDELVVLFKRGQGPDEVVDPIRKEEIQKILDQAGVVSYQKGYVAQEGPVSYRLLLQPGTDLEAAATAISTLPEVESIEANVEAGIFN